MNKPFPNRQSIRLEKYDYTKQGSYFVTICTQNREHLFGEITSNNIKLNDAGKMVLSVWNEIPEFYNKIQIDEFIIMPNHIHGIIQITDTVGAGPCACPNICGQPQGGGQPQGVAPTVLSLPDVVHRFKTMTTKKYTDGVKQNDWIPFPRKLWQRNYWEHIVRNENELNQIRDYIRHNPQKWEMDKLNGGSGNIVMEQTAEYGAELWMV